MRRSYKVACQDAIIMDLGDIDHLQQHPIPLDISHDRQMEILSAVLQAQAPIKREDYELADRIASDLMATQIERDAIEWLVDLGEARRKILKGDKMKAYEIAAALFNNTLAIQQARGERISEKPTTPSALERAINRYGAEFD